MNMEKLLGKNPSQLKEIALAAGLPGFTGNQLAQWLYGKRVRSLSDMTNLSKAGRERLADAYEVGVAEPLGVAASSDGTKKYLFPVNGNPDNAVEAVMIPDGDRKTLCVSSQAGCKMGCKFCMTGRQGFHGNLSAADILSQFLAIDEAAELTNAVFMGMGEPLDNWEEVKKVIEILTAPWGPVPEALSGRVQVSPGREPARSLPGGAPRPHAGAEGLPDPGRHRPDPAVRFHRPAPRELRIYHVRRP